MAAKKSFADWMSDVSRRLAAKVGLSASDLPDCPYHDWYDDGVTAASAASRAVKAARE